VSGGRNHSGLALLACLSFTTSAWGAEPLQLEAKIPLAAVSGRIDHFAYNAEAKLLFIADVTTASASST
jgi:hypothetical protein